MWNGDGFSLFSGPPATVAQAGVIGRLRRQVQVNIRGTITFASDETAQEFIRRVPTSLMASGINIRVDEANAVPEVPIAAQPENVVAAQVPVQEVAQPVEDQANVVGPVQEVAQPVEDQANEAQVQEAAQPENVVVDVIQLRAYAVKVRRRSQQRKRRAPIIAPIAHRPPSPIYEEEEKPIFYNSLKKMPKLPHKLIECKDLVEISQFLNTHFYDKKPPYLCPSHSPASLQWSLQTTRNESLLLGVRGQKRNDLVGFVSAVPSTMWKAGEIVDVAIIGLLCAKKQLRKTSANIARNLIQEMKRRLKAKRISFAIFSAKHSSPASFSRSLNTYNNFSMVIDENFVGETSIPGFRKMEQGDVHEVTQLLQGYFSTFQLAPYLMEDDVAHWLLPREGEDMVHTFVVKDIETGHITDVFSVYIVYYTSSLQKPEEEHYLKVANSYYNVLTKTEPQTLVRDFLVSCKKLQFDCLYRVFSGLKTFQGELWSHGPTGGESRQNGAQRSSIESPRIDRLTRSPLDRSHAKESSIDPMQSDELDRSRQSTLDRSHAEKLDRSRSVSAVRSPGQMISQPFDLLGANRLDRTTANRIEPKSTPELFRPIFSHCLGYAVFQSFTLLFIVSEGEEIKPLFSQFGEDF
ncbi:unnamed protein product [Microthlaspi erraticum]|uniref:Glycylpeptide N-tetradecanoyltransferase n=1 Tax=Microthlaspi erraticum TaxID=1685480 RepID=A0A6D2HF48_9BRAS|nr:unnamed protein product [Microthlaspi erraticum]